MLTGLEGAIDLLIPRGGKGLVARVRDEARGVAVLGHLEGLVHVFLHASADLAKATAIAVNAKMRRVSVCGAAETLLVDSADAQRLLPPVANALRAAPAGPGRRPAPRPPAAARRRGSRRAGRIGPRAATPGPARWSRAWP